MSLRSRAASGQGNVGIYLPCVPEQLLDKEMLAFILPCVPEREAIFFTQSHEVGIT